MTTLLPARIMEFNSGTLLQAGRPREDNDDETHSCSSQASRSAWGDYDPSRPNKRKSTNALNVTPPLSKLQEDNNVPLQKKIKSEPKDDYALAEEECARNASQIVNFPSAYAENPPTWTERGNSGSPVFDRIPSFAAEECHKFTDNCKRCFINETQSSDLDNVSLHRRRQIREFEQSGEEPLSNKIRVWKEKRLEKSFVRGKGNLRTEEEATFLELKGKEPLDEEALSQHHMTTRSRQPSTSSETLEESGPEGADPKFGYIKYLLTRDANNSTSPVLDEDENMVEEPQEEPVVSGDSQVPFALPISPISSQAIEVISKERTSVARKEQTQPKEGKVLKSPRKRLRHSLSADILARQDKGIGCHGNPVLANNNKNKVTTKSRSKPVENGVGNVDEYHEQSNVSGGEFEESYEILRVENTAMKGDMNNTEQYISDIQRPYCNIPDDHQVTHINGVMSLPATRETRYGITLGELKRRTGYPEFLTRVDLIAYVRQSKSAGRALLDKYSIATAGQKSRPTILSKMCENEARVLGDGISRMNGEYFPWKTLARVAANNTIGGKVNDVKVEQKIKAIQNTRFMLKEMYDLTVENKEIPTMKTFEVASHTFGTANILNHLSVFDRLFEEYQSNLMFRRDVRNNNQKL